MEKELQDLIIKYMVQGKEIDKEYFNEVIRIYLKNHNLEGYIYPEVVIANMDNIIAAFIPQKKIIVVSPIGINKIRQDLSKLNDFQGEYFKVLDILQITSTLLHELEHVQQEYVIEQQDKSSIENKLLVITNPTWDTIREQLEKDSNCYDDFIDLHVMEKIEKYNELYQTRLYNLSLRERLAEIRAHKTMLNIIPGLHLPDSFTNFYENLLRYEYKQGYDFSGNITSGPTMDYIDALAQSKLIDPTKCDIYDENIVITYLKTKDELSLEERIELGLPLSQEEYEALSLNVAIKTPEIIGTQK